MLTDERRSLILDRLRMQGRVLAGDLSADFDVSADTVRRDLRELDEAGLLRRVHGGAAMIDGAGEVVALADHDKLGTAMPVVVVPLAAVTHLATDASADDPSPAPYP